MPCLLEDKMSSPLEPDEEFDGSVVAVESSTEIDFNEPLSEENARALTDTIRSAADVLWVLIARAHAGKAWLALGYDTWADYVETEFDMSRSRSYQLLDQGRVVREIESAVPGGTKVMLSEAAARDLKGVLDEVLPEIVARTAGMDADEASDVISEILEEKRERLREERDAAYADADLDDEYFDDLDGDGGYSGDGSGGGGGGRRGGGGGGGVVDDDDRPSPVYNDIDDVDVVAIRRSVNAAHDLYSSLSALAGLPSDLEEVVDIIPRERYSQIDGNLEKAVANLAKFAALWEARKDDDDELEEFEA
jgi:hypothetical protein